jgi:hypothetical protein
MTTANPSTKIIPVRPAAAAKPASNPAAAGSLRRTLGRYLPSRRTLGKYHP